MKKLFAFLIIAVAAYPAHADFTPGSQTIAIFGGAGGSGTEYDYVPGKREKVTRGGGAFGAQYLYYVKGTPAIAFGADITGSQNRNDDQSDLLSGFNTTARLKSTVGLAIARLSFPRGTWRPYIFAGVGGYHATQQLAATPQPGHTWSNGGSDTRMLIDEDESNVAIGAGIGIDIFPTESFFLGLELRNAWLANLDNDDNAAIRAEGFHVDDKNGIAQGNLFLRVGMKF